MDEKQWLARLQLDLAFGGGHRSWIEAEVEAATRQLREAGAPPVDVLGDPTAYAKRCLADRSPIDLMSADTETANDIVYGVAVGLGFVVLLLAGLALRRYGLTLEVSAQTVAAGIGILAVMVTAAASLALRVQGRLRLARRLFIAVAVLFAVSLSVPFAIADRQVALPLLVPAAAALALIYGGYRGYRALVQFHPDRDATPDWFAPLAATLRARHHVPRRIAVDLVAQARQHWADAKADLPDGARPADEFGSIDAYAARLAESAPRLFVVRWAEELVFVALGSQAAWTSIDAIIADRPLRAVVLGLAAVVLAGAGIGGVVSKRRRAARTAGGEAR